MSLEPEAETINRQRAGAGEVALVSIAVSLKRIADAVDGTPEKTGLVDGVMYAIQNGLFKASQR